MPHHAIGTEIEDLAPQVVQITVSFADDDFSFQPGQWVNFRFPEGESLAEETQEGDGAAPAESDAEGESANGDRRCGRRGRRGDGGSGPIPRPRRPG